MQDLHATWKWCRRLKKVKSKIQFTKNGLEFFRINVNRQDSDKIRVNKM